MKFNTSPFESQLLFENQEEQNSRRALTQEDPPDNHSLGAFKRGGLFTSNKGKSTAVQKEFEDNIIKASIFTPINENIKEFSVVNEINFEKENDKKESEIKNDDFSLKTFKKKKIWKKKVFNIIFLVLRFVNAMKLKIISLRIWEAKLAQLNIIGDKIFFPEKKKPINFQGSEIYKRNMILIARERVHNFFNRFQF